MHDISPKTQIACLRADIEEICRERDKAEAEAQALREELKNRTAECNGLHEMLRQEHDRTEKAREEVAALRARVVVLPDRAQHDAGDSEHSDGCVRGFNDCLDELARLNGKAVSEADLRKWLELMEHGDFREGHCMCGSAVDSHGIGDGHSPVDAGEYYAGQVMEELRDLLGEGKEQ